MKPILSILAGILSLQICFAAPTERADAKGYDGIYYGTENTILSDYGNVHIAAPTKLVIFPDGKSSMTTIRYPSGTMTSPGKMVLVGNKASYVMKPSFRFGLILAGTLTGTYTFSPSRMTNTLLTISGKPYNATNPTAIFYKQGTKEASSLERKWNASSTWFSPGETFKGPICNVDQGGIPRAGVGIIGTFIVTNNRGILGALEIIHRATRPGERDIKVSVMHRDIIPKTFQVGEQISIPASGPLISANPLCGLYLDTTAIPFNPDRIKSTR